MVLVSPGVVGARPAKSSEDRVLMALPSSAAVMPDTALAGGGATAGGAANAHGAIRPSRVNKAGRCIDDSKRQTGPVNVAHLPPVKSQMYFAMRVDGHQHAEADQQRHRREIGRAHV